MKIERNEHSANVGIGAMVAATILGIVMSFAGCVKHDTETQAKRDVEYAKAGLVQKPAAAGTHWAKP